MSGAVGGFWNYTLPLITPEVHCRQGKQGLTKRRRWYRWHLATKEEEAETTPILALELTLMGLRARWRCPEGAGTTSRLDPRRVKRCRAALGGRSPGAIPGKLSGHLPSDNHVTHPSSRIQLTASLTGVKY